MRKVCLKKPHLLQICVISATLAALTLGGCSRSENVITGKPSFDSESESASLQPVTVYPFASDMAFSPNGKWLALVVGRPYRDGSSEPRVVDLFVVDFAKRRIASRVKVFERADETIAWSPDGTRLAVFGASAQVWRVGGNGKLVEIAKFSDTIIKTKAGKSISMALAPGKNFGARVVFEDEHPTAPPPKRPVHFEILDPKTKRATRRLTTIHDYPSDQENVWVWPGKKPMVLFQHSSYNGNYKIGSEQFSMWDVATGKRLWQYPTRGLQLQVLEGRGGRDVVITGITGSRGRELYPLHETQQLDARTGRTVRKLNTQSTVLLADVQRNHLLSYGLSTEEKNARHTLKILDLGNGKTLWERPSPVVGTHSRIAFSPDEKWAVFVTGSNVLKFVSLAQLQQGNGSYREMPLLGEDNSEEY